MEKRRFIPFQTNVDCLLGPDQIDQTVETMNLALQQREQIIQAIREERDAELIQQGCPQPLVAFWKLLHQSRLGIGNTAIFDNSPILTITNNHPKELTAYSWTGAVVLRNILLKLKNQFGLQPLLRAYSLDTVDGIPPQAAKPYDFPKGIAWLVDGLETDVILNRLVNTIVEGLLGVIGTKDYKPLKNRKPEINQKVRAAITNRLSGVHSLFDRDPFVWRRNLFASLSRPEIFALAGTDLSEDHPEYLEFYARLLPIIQHTLGISLFHRNEIFGMKSEIGIAVQNGTRTTVFVDTENNIFLETDLDNPADLNQITQFIPKGKLEVALATFLLLGFHYGSHHYLLDNTLKQLGVDETGDIYALFKSLQVGDADRCHGSSIICYYMDSKEGLGQAPFYEIPLPLLFLIFTDQELQLMFEPDLRSNLLQIIVEFENWANKHHPKIYSGKIQLLKENILEHGFLVFNDQQTLNLFISWRLGKICNIITQ